MSRRRVLRGACNSYIEGSDSQGTYTSMRRTVALLVASLALTALTACNTVQGVGRDIESVGRAGENVMR